MSPLIFTMSKAAVRISLAVFGILAITGMLLFARNANAPEPFFNVTWVAMEDGLIHKEYLVTIQNLDPNSNRDFNMQLVLQNLSFPASQVKNVYIHEWKAVLTEFPTYDTRLVKQNCTMFNNETMENKTYDCSYEEQYQNGTVWKMQNQWKPAKMELTTHPDKVTTDYGSITIPKYRSKEKYDDFGSMETVNGTKIFKVSFDVPVMNMGYGWGSSGQVGMMELNTGNYYHPWWNSSFTRRVNITIDNTGNSNNLFNYPVLLNVSFIPGKMVSDFSDLRFTWYNSTDSTEIEIPYCFGDSCIHWVFENKTFIRLNRVPSSYTDVIVNVTNITASGYSTIYMYYGNTTPVTTTQNKTKVFLFEDDFSSGNFNKWTAWGANTVELVGGNYKAKLIPDLNYLRKVNDTSWKDILLSYEKNHSAFGGYGLRLSSNIYYLNDSNRFAWYDEDWPGTDCPRDSLRKYLNGVLNTYVSDGFCINVTKVVYFDVLMRNDSSFRWIQYNSSSYEEQKTFLGTDNNAPPGGNISFATWDTGNVVYLDDVYLRRFRPPEPTYSFGSEENPEYIDSCSVLNVAGMTHYLTADIINSSSSICMQINADNITFDCQGHLIDGIGSSSGVGIGMDNRYNITVKNCSLSDWYKGIEAENGSYVNINNITSSAVKTGIALSNTNNSNIYNFTSSGNQYGILFWNSNENTLYNSRISDSEECGIYLGASDGTVENNHIYNNLLNNTLNFYFSGSIGKNYWNTTKQPGKRIYSPGANIGGNYYTNSSGNGFSDTCTDSNFDGFCDDYYTLAENNTDYLALAWNNYSVSSCMSLNEPGKTYIMTADINDSSPEINYCIDIIAENVTLDCQGHTISGNPTGTTTYTGINAYGFKNVTIKNCTVTRRGSYGIYFNSDYGTLAWNNVNGSGYDIERYGITVTGDYSNIGNNTIYNMTFGLWINCANNNIFTNNTLINNQMGFYGFGMSENNSISGGSVHDSSGYYIEYHMSAGDSVNNTFTDTNFTNTREIYLWTNTTWFNYNNVSGGDIFLKTRSVSGANTAFIHRTLHKWEKTNLTWHEDSISKRSLIYNTSGLLPNTIYHVTNNSAEMTSLRTDSIGQMTFTMDFPTPMDISVFTYMKPPSISDVWYTPGCIERKGGITWNWIQSGDTSLNESYCNFTIGGVTYKLNSATTGNGSSSCTWSPVVEGGAHLDIYIKDWLGNSTTASYGFEVKPSGGCTGYNLPPGGGGGGTVEIKVPVCQEGYQWNTVTQSCELVPVYTEAARWEDWLTTPRLYITVRGKEVGINPLMLLLLLGCFLIIPSTRAYTKLRKKMAHETPSRRTKETPSRRTRYKF